MTTMTWRSGSWNGIGTTTITSPNQQCPNGNNNIADSIHGAIAGPALPTGQKIYWEVRVSGGCSTVPQGIFTYTAFVLGIAVSANENFGNAVLLGAGGGTQANPPGPYKFCVTSYNRGVTIGNANGGTVVAATPGHPANTFWANGSILGFAYDGINKTLQFYQDGNKIWGAFDVAGFGTQPIYPHAQTWSGGRPQATINDGTNAFAHSIPSGFISVAAANAGGVVTPPTGAITSITTVVTPNPVIAGQPYKFTATAHGGNGVFSAVQNIEWSSQVSTNPDLFVGVANVAGTAVSLSTDKTTATITGLSSGTTQPHTAKVADTGFPNATSTGTSYAVNAGAAGPTTVAVNSAAFNFSPGFWYQSTSARGGSTSRTTYCQGGWFDYKWTASATPTLNFTMSSDNPITIDWILNGTLTQNRTLTQGITGIIPSAVNTIRVFYGNNSGSYAHWTVTGATMDSGSTAGTATTGLPWGYFVGDDITEPFGLPATNGYQYLVAKAMPAYAVANQSNNSAGWLTTGEGGSWSAYFPASGTPRWNIIDNVSGTPVSLLDGSSKVSSYGSTSTTPAWIAINLGIDDCISAASTSVLTTQVTAAMTQLRSSTSSTCVLFVIVPFSLYTITNGAAYVAAIKAGFAAYVADTTVALIDLGQSVANQLVSGAMLQGNGYDLNATGAAFIAPLVSGPMLAALAGTPVTIANTSAAFKYSPFAWAGTARSGGSGSPNTCKVGSWWSVTWNASSTPTALMNLAGGSGTTAYVSYFVNGTLRGDRIAVANGAIQLTGLVPNSSNTALFYYVGRNAGTVWNAGVNTVTVGSLVVDHSSSAGTAPAAKPSIILVGDGWLTGYETDYSTATGPNPIVPTNGQNFLKSHGYQLSGSLTAYDIAIDAVHNGGWLTTGGTSNDVPAYYFVSGGTYNASLSRWNLVNNGVSVLDGSSHFSAYGATSTQPSAILVNLGINDALTTKSTSDLTASVTQAMVALRAANPTAIIGIVVPFNYYATAVFPATYIAALKAGYNAYVAAHGGDTAVALMDLGASTSATIEAGSVTPVASTISAQMSLTWTLSGSVYTYTLTVLNNGNTNIGTFWFAWTVNNDLLVALPTPSNPASWTSLVAGAAGHYSVQWTTASAPIVPGADKQFVFTSTDAPAYLAGHSSFNPSLVTTTSAVYVGAPQVGISATFPATTNNGIYVNPDNIYGTVAGQSFVTPLLSNSINTALTPVTPVATTQGLPFYGWGCELAFANAGQSQVAKNFAWFIKYFCIPRTMLYYSSNDRSGPGQNGYIQLYGANLWATDPNLNGTNTGKKCIPIQGVTSACLDGSLSWAGIISGQHDSIVTGTLAPWASRNWTVVFQRWGYEDNYTTTPSGEGSYYTLPSTGHPEGQGQYPYHANAGHGGDQSVISVIPWMIYGKTGWNSAYIAQWRHSSRISKAFAASHNLKLFMGWGPMNLLYQDPPYTLEFYPDNDLSDGNGSLVDSIAPDWYCTGFYGPTTTKLYPGYNTQLPYTPFTGTVGSDPTGPSNSTWFTSLGTLYYAMDYITGAPVGVFPPTVAHHTQGYSSQEFFGWSLSKGKGICIPEFGGFVGPGSNYVTNTWDGSKTGTAPWLGAYIRSRLNWFTDKTKNGVANGQIQQISFWYNQDAATLQGMAQAFPEFLSNPDAGQTSGGTITKAIFSSPIPTVAVGAPVTIGFYLTYTPLLANLAYDPGTGIGFQSLPGNAVLNGTTNSVAFSFTATSVGSFQMSIKDTANNVTALPIPYSVAIPLPNGVSILVPPIPQQTGGQSVQVQIAFNGYIPNQANVQLSHSTSTNFLPVSSGTPVWTQGGQLLTVTFTDGIQSDHVTTVEDTTFAPPLVSNTVHNAVSTSGGGGLVTVTPPIPASTQSTITISSPGTIQEASVGAGVTPTLTITAQNIPNNQVFWGVFNSSNSLVGSFSVAVSVASGQATISPFLALSGYYVKVVDNVASPTVSGQSAPVTITDVGNVTPTISVSAPGTLSLPSGATTIATNIIITTSNLSTIWWGVYNSSNTLYAPLVSLATSGSVTVSATLHATGDYVGAQNLQTSPTVTAKSATAVVQPSAATPTLSITSPGTLTEPLNVSSVQANLAITATNLIGPVFWSLLTGAGGGLISGPFSQALTNGTAIITATFSATGQAVQVVDNPNSPTVSATSGAVTIVQTAPPVSAITISAPGTIQEASVGVGVTPTMTAQTTNLIGGLSYSVVRSGGVVEAAPFAILPDGATIIIPNAIPNQTAGQAFSVQIAFNYVPIQSNITIAKSVTSDGLTYIDPKLFYNPVWDGTGQLLTITTTDSLSVQHSFSVKDSTPTSPLTSQTINYNVGAAGGGGTVTVASAPTPPPNPEQYTFSSLMLFNRDFIRATASVQPVNGIGGSAYVTFTGTGPYTYSVVVYNNGTLPIGTFWFAWAPGVSYLPSSPTPSNPTGWANSVIPETGAYSIEWTTSTNQIAVGASTTFTFTSADSPATLFALSTINPGAYVTTFTTYTDAPFVSPANVAVAYNNTIQGITAISSPVIITDAGSPGPTLTVSAPGTIQESSIGIGVTPVLTVTPGNLTGNLFYEVLTAAGFVESGYVQVAIPGGWSAVVTDNFTRANTSVGGAGTTTGAGNNWTDVFGGVWNIASNKLHGSINNHNIVAWLTRPSGEAALNTRIADTFVNTNAGNMAEVGLVLRQQVGNITLNYLARYLPVQSGATPVISIFLYNNGGTQLAVSGTLSLTNAASYTLDFSAVGTNPTVLTLVLFDNTGAQVANITANDSTSGLQVAGTPGLVTWSAPSHLQTIDHSNVVTYTGSGGQFTISPHMLSSGDYVQIVNNIASPTTTAQSSPVTITDVNQGNPNQPTIALSSTNVSIAPNGVSYTVKVQISTTNITSGTVQLQVLAPNGSVETPYSTVTLIAGEKTVTVPFQTSGDSIQVVDQVNNPTVVATTGPINAPSIVPAAITVNQPFPLFIGTQGITGFYTVAGADPSNIYIAFSASQPNNVTDPGVVPASIFIANNQFSAVVDIANPNVLQTLWYSTDGNSWTGAWTTTPQSSNTTFSANPLPNPLLPGPLTIGGAIGSGQNTLQVALIPTQAGAPTAGNPAIVDAEIQTPNWTATVVGGQVGVPETLWYSVNGAAFIASGQTATPVGQIIINQPSGQFTNTPYIVPVDFNYILNIPQAGPIPSTLTYSETGGAPFTQVQNATNGYRVTRTRDGNTRIILNLQESAVGTVQLVVQDSAPPGGGIVTSPIVSYPVAAQQTATGSPFITIYNPGATQAGVAWTGIADFNYLVNSLATLNVAYLPGSGYTAVSSLVSPNTASLQPNPNVVGASRVVFTLTDPNPGNVLFQVQDTAPPGVIGAIQSGQTAFAVLSGPPPVTSATRDYRTIWDDGSQQDIIKPVTTQLVSAGFVGGGPTTATSIGLWTPPAAKPSILVTLTGTFIGGPPVSLDYSIDSQATWTTALAGNIGINASTFTYSLTIPAGVAAGTYAAGQIAVRDTNNHAAVGGTPGAWVVSSFSPVTPSAGTLIFGTQVSNPAFTITDNLGHVVRLNDIGGSGRFLTVGPTTPPNNVTGSVFSGNNPVGLRRGTGGDGGQTSLGMTTTVNSLIFDNSANYFGAGALGGVNDPLINMTNAANISNNNWVVIFGAYLDVTKKYQGGPIWGAWNTSTTGIFVTAGRWNGGNGSGPFTIEVDLAGAGGQNWFPSQTTISSSGFHVFTAQQVGATLRYRIDGGAWVTTTISGTNAYSSTQFSYGGSIIQNIGNIQSGNSFAQLFDMLAFSGTPSDADMSSAQKWVASQMGTTSL